jgi:cell division septation protein DedD
MGRLVSGMVIGAVAVAGTASAQTPGAPRAGATAQQAAVLEQVLQLKESRYQIGQIERLLEGAVEHGATVIRDRLLAIMPADMLLTDNARVRGFRLDGYGVFFDVEVPNLEGTLPWSFRTLDQNDLGVGNALQTIRSFIQASSTSDPAIRQALERIELQLTPSPGLVSTSAPAAGARTVSTQSTTTATAAAAANPPSPVSNDPILANPNEAYRAAIRSALIEAMLEHTRGLNLAPNEWLTVAARASDDRPRLAPADTEGQTNILSIRGSDLAAFLAGSITLDEAKNRVDVRVF